MKSHTLNNIFITALTVLTAIIAVLLVGVKIFGITPYVIMSPSMEPEYHTGSLVYVKSVDVHSIVPGDVITFRLSSDSAATHRVTEITESGGELLFHTKGDANELGDAQPLHESDILGKVVFTIPTLGYLASFINTSKGKIFAIVYGILLLMLIVFSDDKRKTEIDADNKRNMYRYGR